MTRLDQLGSYANLLIRKSEQAGTDVYHDRIERTLDEITRAAAALPKHRAMTAHNIPIRPDLVITLNLPTDLTAAEADRLAIVIHSLAFEEEQ